MKHCVITGLGVICSIGNKADEVWRNAVNGVCGIREIKSFQIEGCNSKYGAEINSFKPSFACPNNFIRRLDRVSLICIEAVTEALNNAKLTKDDVTRAGVVMGSCTGGVLSAEKFQRQWLINPKKVNPMDIIRMPINTIAGNIAWFLKAHGPVANIVNACAAGTISIAYACDLIKQNLADIVIAGGTDTIAPLPFSGFNSLQALDNLPCSPFSRSKGISLGEGAGVVIIESLEHALVRKANIYCEVVGYGITSDAYHITAPRPDGEGQMDAIKLALAEAGIDSSKIDYLNAHGTGTPLNDSAEINSLSNVFNNDSNYIKISSSKSMIGHCLGAAGAIEAVIAIKALHNNEIPPTINFTENTSAPQFDFVPNQKIKRNLNYVMSNSFAFGGNNASIIFSKDLKRRRLKNNRNNRVFITGLGIVSPIGIGIDEYWTNACNGKRGFSSTNYENKSYRSKYAAILKLPNLSSFGISGTILRKLDRISSLLILSGILSLKDAGITLTAGNEKTVGTVIGTSDGPATEIANFQKGMIEKGIHAGSPFLFPNTVYNAAGGHLSIAIISKGYTITFANGFNAGLYSICHGYDLLKMQRQKIVIASGVDEYSEVHHLLYDTLHVLDEESDMISRPYCFQRRGFILGEGSTSIILETEEQAVRRGARRYAEIIGYGLSTTPVGPGKIESDGRGLDQAIIQACESAQIDLEDIDAVMGFANGKSEIDQMEIKSYLRVFGDRITTIPIYTIKNFVGEGRAATSALQAAHAALMLTRQERPVTRGDYYTSISYQDKNLPLTEQLTRIYRNILVNSFSFGGAYSSILLRKVE